MVSDELPISVAAQINLIGILLLFATGISKQLFSIRTFLFVPIAKLFECVTNRGITFHAAIL